MAHKQLGSRDYTKKVPTYKIGHLTCPKCASLNELYWTRDELLSNIKEISNRSFVDPNQIFPELSTIQAEPAIDTKSDSRYNVVIENINARIG